MTEKKPESLKKQNEDRNNDMEYVIQVDRQFVERVDDIVKSLDLHHIKVVPDNKKKS